MKNKIKILGRFSQYGISMAALKRMIFRSYRHPNTGTGCVTAPHCSIPILIPVTWITLCLGAVGCGCITIPSLIYLRHCLQWSLRRLELRDTLREDFSGKNYLADDFTKESCPKGNFHQDDMARPQKRLCKKWKTGHCI